jgi:hypothetical protein
VHLANEWSRVVSGVSGITSRSGRLWPVSWRELLFNILLLSILGCYGVRWIK